MSYSTKTRPLSYVEASRAFADPNVRDDINDACSRLSQLMSSVTERFAAIARQMHSIDLQRAAPPIKPRWDALSKVRTTQLLSVRCRSRFI